MKNYLYLCLTLVVGIVALSQPATASLAFDVGPSTTTLGTFGSQTFSITATNGMATDVTLNLLPDSIELTVDGNTGANVTGNEGINGQVSMLVSDSTLVAANGTVEIATITFTDTLGGTPSVPRTDVFSTGFFFGVDAPATLLNFAGGDFTVNAIPEPVTALTFIVGLGLISQRRRR